MPTDLDRVRQALKQQLESLRRAGVTHLPRGKRELQFDIPSPPVKSRAEDHTPRPAPVTVQPTPPQPIPQRTPGLFDAGAKSVPGPCTLSLSEREAELASLAEQVALCTRCPALAETRTQTVFGVGNPQARILFLGEAPGADEDRTGIPFVGAAGQLLDRIIKACTLTREEIYICNILRCRPPMNRNPLPEEAAHCREWLDAQIRVVDPEYIICWGSVAAKNLLDTTASVGKLRGKFYQYGRAKVLCTYHPSYLLRNPSAKKDVWEDMKFFMRDLGVDLGTK